MLDEFGSVVWVAEAAESGEKQSIFERQMSADLKYRATQI